MHWKHKNLLIFLLGILLAFFVSQNQSFRTYLLNLGDMGYVGAFIAGALYTFSFTTPLSIVILSILSQTVNPVQLALIGGAGAVLMDLTIFRFVKDDLISDIKPLYDRFGGDHVTHVFNSRYFHWMLPVVGALIISSPLPDELGVTLMGIAKMKTIVFIPISYAMNTLGIFLIAGVSSLTSLIF